MHALVESLEPWTSAWDAAALSLPFPSFPFLFSLKEKGMVWGMVYGVVLHRSQSHRPRSRRSWPPAPANPPVLPAGPVSRFISAVIRLMHG